MTRKSKTKFGLKGYTPYTKTYSDEETLKLWEEFQEEQRKEKEEENKRLKIHRPEEGDY